MDIKYKSGLIKVQKVNYKGRDYIDIRKFYQDYETGEWRPTPKGISFDPEILQEIIKALQKL